MKWLFVCAFLTGICIMLSHQAMAVNFYDHTGYEPTWASSINEIQVITTCTSAQYGTNDFRWCGEYSGYILDQSAGRTSVSFNDSTGYEPNWALKMGTSQALSVCSTVQYGTKDSNWCYEFSSYMLKQPSTPTNSTNTQPTNLQPSSSNISSIQQSPTNQVDITQYFPKSNANIFNNNLWDITILQGSPDYASGAIQSQTQFYKSDYLDAEPTTEVGVSLFPDDQSASIALSGFLDFYNNQKGFQVSAYNASSLQNCYEAKAPSDIAYIDNIICKEGNLVITVSANGNQWQTPPMAEAFLKAVLSDISTQQTSSTTMTPINEKAVFAPCPMVETMTPSYCLSKYLPDPRDIGVEWISGSQSIPAITNPNPSISQYVHDDYENTQINPEEVFDVVIEEWTSGNTAYSAFKSDESSASNSKIFSGKPQSNDTTFAYISDLGYGQLGYHDEFVLGTVIVMVDGTGGTSQTTINDMSTITKTILNKIVESIKQNNSSVLPQNPIVSTTANTQTNSQTQIPSWIKNNAKWWSVGSVGDTDFIKGIQYLIQQGIIRIPPTSGGISSSQQIPQWVKNTAGWWANGQVSDDEFVKAIQYMINNGIIAVS